MAELTDTRSAVKTPERRVVAGLLALAAVYVAALGWQFRDAVVDDAFIGLVYLRNLLDGHGFVFHADSVPVEGISNVGWIFVSAPLAVLVGPVAAAKLMGGVLLFIALVLTGKLGRELGRRMQHRLPHADTLMLAPPLLLAASFEFLFFSLAGMETALLSCVLLCMAAGATRNAPSVLMPILGALAFTVHPEAVLVYPLFVVLRALKNASPSRPASGGHPRMRWFAITLILRRAEGPSRRMRDDAVPVLHIAPFLLYAALLALITTIRWAEFGALLPNTFAAKPVEISTAFSGLLEFFTGNYAGIGFPIAGLWGIGLLVLGWLRLRQATHQPAAMLGAIVATGVIFAVYARPDWTLSARYFAPYLPAALLLFWVGALDLADRLWPARIMPVALLGATVLCLQGLTLGARLGAMDVYPGYVMTSRSLIAPAKAIARLVPEHDTIATRRIGALAYVSDRRVFDYVYGLTDAEVARAVAKRGKVFDQPTDGELAPIWRARAPEWILEDEPVLADIARRAGGTLDSFTLNGFSYRAVQRFPLTPDTAWVLAGRIEDNPRPAPY